MSRIDNCQTYESHELVLSPNLILVSPFLRIVDMRSICRQFLQSCGVILYLELFWKEKAIDGQSEADSEDVFIEFAGGVGFCIVVVL